MNFIKVFQQSIFTLLAIYGTMIVAEQANCDIKPIDVETCDENNVCNCPNKDSNQVDCTATFRNVCAEKILGPDEYKKFLCCSRLGVPPALTTEKGFQACVDVIPGLADKIASCMEGQAGDCPQAIALKNVQELTSTGIELAKNMEPFFVYNGIFDKCISEDSVIYFLQTICGMLKKEIAMSFDQCKSAMGW